ncbi:CBS domain-containing protein [Myxococcus xanthus]
MDRRRALTASKFTIRQQGVRRLPIVDERGRRVGLVSLDDLWGNQGP